MHRVCWNKHILFKHGFTVDKLNGFTVDKLNEYLIWNYFVYTVVM